jgi:indole-3-glycerol phosphate synthase
MKVSRYDLLNKQCPLLCKEFIIDAWQLYYARSKGADAVLLIAAVLPDRDINYMLKICKKLGMAALVEVSELLLQYVLYAQAFRLSYLAALH